MTRNVRSWAVGLALAAVVVYLAGQGFAGGAKLTPDVRKVADAIKKGDKAGAEAAAAKTAKKLEELGDIMHMFKLRNKGGIGIGETPSTKADGIEARFLVVARDVPTNLSKEAPGLEQAGYDTAAIALISKAMAPKDMGKKKKSDFVKWSDEMYDNGIAFAKTVKGGGAQDVKAAAAKVNASCASCHSVFRE